MPLAATGDHARFVVSLPGPTDVSTATVAFRVIKRQGTGGSFRLFIQSGAPDFSLAFSSATSLESSGSSVRSVTWSIADADTSLDKKAVERVGIEIAGVGGNTWANPTVLYVDRVDVSGTALGTGSFPFESAASVYTRPTASGPSGSGRARR